MEHLEPILSFTHASRLPRAYVLTVPERCNLVNLPAALCRNLYESMPVFLRLTCIDSSGEAQQMLRTTSPKAHAVMINPYGTGS